MNQFLPLIRNNPGFSLDDLRSEYRVRVKQVHPDTGAGSGELFIRLKEDFDEACLLIDEAMREEKGPPPLSRGESRVQFFERFFDFLKRGFLTSREKIIGSHDYKKALQAVRLSWALWRGPVDEGLDSFLADFASAHARSPFSNVWQRMSAFLYSAMEVLCPYAVGGTVKQKKALAARNYDDALKLVRRIYVGFPALASFLDFLRAELE
jgi:hypothetical protein